MLKDFLEALLDEVKKTAALWSFTSSKRTRRGEVGSVQGTVVRDELSFWLVRLCWGYRFWFGLGSSLVWFCDEDPDYFCDSYKIQACSRKILIQSDTSCHCVL